MESIILLSGRSAALPHSIGKIRLPGALGADGIGKEIRGYLGGGGATH